MELYKFQEQAIHDLTIPHKHIVISGVGSGKGSMALHWLRSTGKKHWLVVTTASKRDSQDFQHECDAWFGEQQRKSLSSFAVISWEGLAKWTVNNWAGVDKYAYVFDEVQKGKAGTSSARGRAFLQITNRTDCWAGFTATPGDKWIDFQAYFVAGHYIKNKTQFQREFCQIQTFRGFPEIVGYHNEPTLKTWWERMTVCPDTSQMERELPSERHRTYEFKTSIKYKNVLKTRELYGQFLDTPGALCAALRRLCFTKEKQQWLTDYLEGLGTNAVLFYQFTDTGDAICNLAKKALPKGARVWRICGSKHEIPTAETIGKYDIVVCQWLAGSEALNLQFMHEWVSVEPHYAYSTSEQARGRIRRIGQTKPMRFHYLMCPHSIEGDIYRALRDKSVFAQDVWYEALKEGKE